MAKTIIWLITKNKASVDTLCRDDTSEISRDPASEISRDPGTKRLKRRRESLAKNTLTTTSDSYLAVRNNFRVIIFIIIIIFSFSVNPLSPYQNKPWCRFFHQTSP